MENNEKRVPEEFFPQVSNEEIIRKLSLWMTIALQRGCVLDYQAKVDSPVVDLDDVPLPCQDTE